MDWYAELRKIARQICCLRLNPLQYFDEAEGATLVKKGLLEDETAPRLVLTDGSNSLGSATNVASGGGSAVGGGSGNTASGYYSVVGGGDGNTASDGYATISGGTGNAASQGNSTVGGGESNTASGDNSTVGGGQLNQATAQSATVVGGDGNVATAYGATVLGGSENTASGAFSVAGGSAATARHQGEFAFANGGLAQFGHIVAYKQTTNATPAQVTLDGASAMIVPNTGEVWGIRARIVARCVAASKAWVTDLEFAVTNFGGTLAQLGTTDTGFNKITGSTTWTAAVYISGDNVSVTVTGAVGETVEWGVDFWYTKIGQ